MDLSNALEPVLCHGAPEDVGAAYGALNAESIHEHLDAFVDTCDEKGLDRAAIIEKSARGMEIIREKAPYWELEQRAVAEAAGIDPAMYGAFAIGKYRGLFFGPECTSYAAAGSWVPYDGAAFHKSRDNKLRTQCCFVRKIVDDTHKPYGWCGTSDTSDMTTMTFVNERGLAGASDQGGRLEDFKGEGLMNTFGLRYFAETCSTCADVQEALRHWHERGYYAGGAIRTHWLFADAQGHILRVVHENQRIEFQPAHDNIVVNKEREGLREFLQENRGRLDATELTAASRLESVSMESTISALSVDLKPEAPEWLTCAWFSLGRPTQAPYVPVFMASNHVPRALMDGTMYRLSIDAPAATELLRDLEADWYERVSDCQDQIRQEIDDDNCGEIPYITEALTATCVQEALELMAGQSL
ncbi:MAG: hypothetical protein R6V19_01280 [Armatimonadota bacterium]